MRLKQFFKRLDLGAVRYLCGLKLHNLILKFRVFHLQRAANRERTKLLRLERLAKGLGLRHLVAPNVQSYAEKQTNLALSLPLPKKACKILKLGQLYGYKGYPLSSTSGKMAL